MARISKYALDTYISNSDKLIGTDAEDSSITKNFLVGDLADFINSAEGTENTIAMFSTSGLTDSLITQAGSSIAIAGNVTSERVNATQVVIEGNTAPLVLKKDSTINSHIKMESTDENGFISSRDSHIGIGGTNGYSTSNINVNKSNGYLGVQQKNPLAPLHVKRNGEAIRLEGSGDNITSIDFRQGTNKRGHIEFDNGNDTIEIKTTNPTGSLSKIKFSVASGVGQEGTEVMRVQKNQVVIGNPVSANSDKELYIDGVIETTGILNVFLGSLSVGGRVDADVFKLKGLNTAPPSSASPGAVGEIRFTAGYIYVCIATDRWRRAALTDW